MLPASGRQAQATEVNGLSARAAQAAVTCNQPMPTATPRLPWHIPLVFAVTFVVHYLDRNLVSFALPQMARERGWSDQQTGEYGQYLLGAFFLSYGFAQLWLSGAAERLGAKRSLVLVITGFSLVSMAMGPLGGSLAALVVLRLLLGVCESVHVPMMGVITARRFPQEVRARANATWNVGIIVATAIGAFVTVPLITHLGWRASFVVIGGAGLLLALPLVVLFVSDGPAGPRASGTQRRAYRRNPDYWLYVACGVLNAFCGFGILGWLPTYFVRAKSIDFAALGWPLSTVFGAGVVGTLTIAWLGDRLRRRVLLAAIGFGGAAAALSLAIPAQGFRGMVALFALAVFCQSAFQAQEHATIQLLAGDTDVGPATGTYNGTSLILGGVVGSVVPGAVVAATGSFDAALSTIAAAAGLAALACGWLAWRMREGQAPHAQGGPG
jgi:sugar phosphate permease